METAIASRKIRFVLIICAVALVLGLPPWRVSSTYYPGLGFEGVPSTRQDVTWAPIAEVPGNGSLAWDVLFLEVLYTVGFGLVMWFWPWAWRRTVKYAAILLAVVVGAVGAFVLAVYWYESASRARTQQIPVPAVPQRGMSLSEIDAMPQTTQPVTPMRGTLAELMEVHGMPSQPVSGPQSMTGSVTVNPP